MFDWVLLAAPVNAHATPKKDYYVGVVASEVAYASLLSDTAPVKPLVDTKDCKRCNGTGKISTGDSNNPWTDCPECEPKEGEIKSSMPLPSMKLQVKPLPSIPTSDCPTGTCPVKNT
jgi:hypothetical protein